MTHYTRAITQSISGLPASSTAVEVIAPLNSRRDNSLPVEAFTQSISRPPASNRGDIETVMSSFIVFMGQGAFLVTDNRVLKGPLGRSLRLFARTAHSLRSLPHGTFEIHEYE